MEQTKDVGIWIRVSTEDQARGDSPEHHEASARQYAQSRNWNVVTVYHLEGVSGKSVMDHPEAKRMLEDIRTGRISGLIFSKLARLARNTKQLLEFAEYFTKYNADLISLGEAIDTSTPSGRLFYTIIAAMSQWEREEIAGRTAAMVPVRAKLGKSTGGAASFGYRWENNELKIDETEAPARKLIYELFLKLRRKRTVARELNNAGYRTRNGSGFSDTTIHRLLRDTTAKGVRRANYTKSQGGNRNWKMKPESEWILVPCPAIVSVEVWEECNRILDEQEGKWKKSGPRPVQLLAGYVTCTCGKAMYVYSRSKNYACKPCRRKIPADDLEDIYHEHLKDFLLTESDTETYLSRITDDIRESQNQQHLLSEELVVIRDKMDKIVEMRINGELSKENLARHYEPLEERRLQIERQLAVLEGEIAALRVHQMSSDIILYNARSLYESWQTLDFNDKRSVIEAITKEIIIGEEEISLKLAYLPSQYSSQPEYVMQQDDTVPPHSLSQNAGKRQRIDRDSWRRSK